MKEKINIILDNTPSPWQELILLNHAINSLPETPKYVCFYQEEPIKPKWKEEEKMKKSAQNPQEIHGAEAWREGQQKASIEDPTTDSPAGFPHLKTNKRAAEPEKMAEECMKEVQGERVECSNKSYLEQFIIDATKGSKVGRKDYVHMIDKEKMLKIAAEIQDLQGKLEGAINSLDAYEAERHECYSKCKGLELALSEYKSVLKKQTAEFEIQMATNCGFRNRLKEMELKLAKYENVISDASFAKMNPHIYAMAQELGYARAELQEVLERSKNAEKERLKFQDYATECRRRRDNWKEKAEKAEKELEGYNKLKKEFEQAKKDSEFWKTQCLQEKQFYAEQFRKLEGNAAALRDDTNHYNRDIIPTIIKHLNNMAISEIKAFSSSPFIKELTIKGHIVNR